MYEQEEWNVLLNRQIRRELSREYAARLAYMLKECPECFKMSVIGGNDYLCHKCRQQV
jgi:hypothetical protein